MSGRLSFAELPKDFTRERRQRIIETKGDLLVEVALPAANSEKS